LPEQPVSLLEDRAGKPQADAGNENPDKILPEEFSPELVELERPPVQGGGANFDDFHPGSIIERLEAQGPLSQNEIRYRGDSDPTSATATITVTSVNDAPVASADAYATNEDTALVIAAGAGVLANDTDIDLDAPTVTAFDAVSANAGTVAMNPDGSFTYTPAADFSGADAFTYTISDGNGGSDVATVSLTVNPVNDAPTTNPAAASGPEDATSIAVTLSGSDIDGTVASFSLSTLPAGGTLYTDAALTSPVATATDYAATAGSRTLYFVPDPDFNGAASFNFAAKDDAGDSDPTSATATITVTSVNDAPVAADDSILTNIVDGSAITIPIAALLANDSDPDGDALTGFAVVGDTGGTAVVVAGNVVFTPDPGAFTAGSFSHTVSDGVATSAPTLVTIAGVTGDTITGGPDPEVLIGDDVSLILSTLGDATLGGLPLANEDLVEYDPVTDTATLFFDGSALFTRNEDIDAVHVLSKGHIILSTTGNARLGGLTFANEDLVEYDPVTDTATLFFDGSALFVGDQDTDAVHVIGSDALTGAVGDDWLDGGAGSDSLDGGDRDDVLVWDSADMALDGGSGTDTLRVDNGNADFTTFNGTITGIEMIDLDADTGANSVTLTAQDVLDLSDTDTLTILGDTADSIDAGTAWTDGGFDGSGNHAYTQMVGASLATLLVDPDISVNPDILT
jgi:hypothetical protein